VLSDIKQVYDEYILTCNQSVADYQLLEAKFAALEVSVEFHEGKMLDSFTLRENELK
jgi:hypothetical protein